MTTDMIERIRFFAKHGGYCEPPGRMACAKALAEAEVLAEELELTVKWEYEANPDLDFDFERDRRDFESGRFDILMASIDTDCGDMLAHLGRIWIRPDDHAYRRVVEAELFAEAIETLKSAEVAS